MAKEKKRERESARAQIRRVFRLTVETLILLADQTHNADLDKVQMMNDTWDDPEMKPLLLALRERLMALDATGDQMKGKDNGN